MPLFSLLEINPAWQPFVDVIVRASCILGAGALLAGLLRRASAAARHLVWTTTLAAALALPVLSAALPEWTVPVLSVQQERATSSHDATAIAPPVRSGPDFMRASTPVEAAPGLDTRGPAPANLLDRAASLSWTTSAALVYVAVAAVILLRLATGLLAVRLMARRTAPADDAPWYELARTLAADLGIARVTFRRSMASTMPMTWGVVKPVVLMPAEADAWPHERLRIVLLHELAHVRRADCLTHLLAQITCAVYWINPLSWVAARRARAERERACDDLVLACGTPGADYAAQLLDVARVMRGGRLSTLAAGASLAMAHRSQLEGRLMAILDPSIPRSTVSRLRTLAAAASALLLVAPLATIEPWVEIEAAVLPVRQLAPQPPPAPAPAPVAAPAPAPAPAPIVRGQMRQPSEAEVERITEAAVAGVLRSLPEVVDSVVEGAVGAIAPAQSAAPDPKVVAALMEALKDSDRDVRESAMHALVRMRHPGILEPLIQALRDSSPEIREHAAFGLGQLRDKRAIEGLRSVLKDQSAGVREQAVFALGQLRDPSTIDALVEALRDQAASVREQAVFSLGQLRDQRAADPLMAALRDANGSVREQAAFALGQLRSKAAVDALMAALKESDVDVREQAAFALGQIGDPRAIDALMAALKDSSAQVRQQVAFALGQLAR
jgi:HEAT repeat protein/beta-lactamase regulating signal transducer with metallopeptidase domain